VKRTSLLCLYGLALVLAACDPVNEDAIAGLGGEAPGVRQGPLHRPGQPCLLCHDGQVGDPPAFSVAGTLFETPGALVGADLATVSLTDSADGGYRATTNTAGNFYVTPGEWTPTFPITIISVVDTAGVKATMHSEVGRDGACASCHVDPAGPASPGHVSMSAADGGPLP
jgi:hypothetical protein